MEHQQPAGHICSRRLEDDAHDPMHPGGTDALGHRGQHEPQLHLFHGQQRREGEQCGRRDQEGLGEVGDGAHHHDEDKDQAHRGQHLRRKVAGEGRLHAPPDKQGLERGGLGGTHPDEGHLARRHELLADGGHGGGGLGLPSGVPEEFKQRWGKTAIHTDIQVAQSWPMGMTTSRPKRGTEWDTRRCWKDAAASRADYIFGAGIDTGRYDTYYVEGIPPDHALMIVRARPEEISGAPRRIKARRPGQLDEEVWPLSAGRETTTEARPELVGCGLEGARRRGQRVGSAGA